MGKAGARGGQAVVCGVLGAVGCAALFGGKSGPFWSTDDLGATAAPSGLLAAVLADRPAPRAPLPEELAAVEVPAGVRLERVLGRRAMEPGGPVVFLPDGRRLLSLAETGDLRVWDPVTRAQLALFPACEKGRATALALSRDGKLAASAIAGGRICVRDLADGHVVRSWTAHAAPIKALAFTTGGEILSYAYQREVWAPNQIGATIIQQPGGGELRRWRLGEERPAGEFYLGPADAVAFAADGSLMVARDLEGALRALDGRGQTLWTAKAGEYYYFALVDHDRQLLAINALELHLLDARTGHPLGELKATSALHHAMNWRNEPESWSDCIVPTPDGRHVITALREDSFLFVWDLAARREVEHPHGLTFPACHAVFSPDGTVLASNDLQLWDAIARLPLGAGVYAEGISADGRRAVGSGGDLSIRLWDLDRGVEIARRRLAKPATVRLSAAGDRMLLGFENEWARVADVATGAEIWSLGGRAGKGPWALSPDGQLAVTSTYTGIGLTVHDVTTGKGLWNTPLPDYEPAIAAFSPDSRLLAYTDRYHQLCVRTARDGREVQRLPGTKRLASIAFSPDGRYLLSVEFGDIVIFDLAGSGKEVRRIEYPGGMTALGPGVLAFSPGQASRSIELSRLADGAALGKITIGERFGVVSSLALAAGGTRLLVATSRGQTLVFAMPSRF